MKIFTLKFHINLKIWFIFLGNSIFFHHKKDSKVPKSWSILFEISQDSMDLLEKEDLVIPDILKSMDAVITGQMVVCLCRLTDVFCKGLPL